MNEDIINQTTSEELISVPSFLSSNYAVATAATCSCMAEQGDPCGTGEWCSECSCQGWECGESCSQSCSQSCSESCGDSQMACGECSSQGGCAGGQCGSAQWCGGCEDGCQDCQTSCQNSCQNGQGVKVTCTKISYFYNNNGSILLSTESETERNLTPGLTFTPGHSSHMPNYDSDQYSLYSIKYNGTTLSSSSSITCPSSNFTVYYYFRRILTIDKWSWTSSNGSATDAQTKAAYKAITEKGSTANFSYKVWNDMVDKVVAAWHAQGGYFNTDILSYEETCMTSTNKILTAKRFNSLRRNIGLNYSTEISNQSSGDPVLGEYFITLADCLNGWIDNL